MKEVVKRDIEMPGCQEHLSNTQFIGEANPLCSGRVSLVTSQNNELIPTRKVFGWVCIVTKS